MTSKIGCVLDVDFRPEVPVDRSVFGHALTNHGSLWNLDGRKFDGVDDYVDCGNDASLNITGNLSFGLWIMPDVWDYYNLLFDKSNNGHTGYEVSQGSGSIFFTLRQSYSIMASASVSTSFFPVGEWHYLSGVWDGKDISIYADGIQKDSAEGTATSSAVGNLVIGKDDLYSIYYFNGTIDKVRVYNYALTSQQILANYYGDRKL